MVTLKEKSIQAIQKLDDDANIDDIMYQLFVIDKIRKGEQAIEEKKTYTVNELEEEIKQW